MPCLLENINISYCIHSSSNGIGSNVLTTLITVLPLQIYIDILLTYDNGKVSVIPMSYSIRNCYVHSKILYTSIVQQMS